MQAITIEDLLEDQCINLSLEANTKKEVIDQLSKMLETAGYITDFDIFAKDVFLREKEGITGMGNGIAIPHGKSEAVNRASVAIGRTKKFIGWESYDGLPVNLFFLFAVPSGKHGAKIHLKLLSQLATKLANDVLIEELKKTPTVTDFKRILMD